MQNAATQSDDGLEQFAANARSAIVSACEEIGGLGEDDMREQLSTAYPPASEPGAYPNRRTGQLAAGATHSVDESEVGVELVVEVQRNGSSEVPFFLDNGTSKMLPRPISALSREKWESKMQSLLPDLVRQNYQG